MRFLLMFLLLGGLFFSGCTSDEERIVGLVEANDAEGVKAWLDEGGSPDFQTEAGVSLLYLSANHKKAGEVTKVLLEEGALPNLGNGNRSPLMNAAINMALGSAEYLVEAGADVTQKDNEGKTAYDMIPPCSDCPKTAKMQALLEPPILEFYDCEDGAQVQIAFRGNRARVEIQPRNGDLIEFTAFKIDSDSVVRYLGDPFALVLEEGTCAIEQGGEVFYSRCKENRKKEK